MDNDQVDRCVITLAERLLKPSLVRQYTKFQENAGNKHLKVSHSGISSCGLGIYGPKASSADTRLEFLEFPLPWTAYSKRSEYNIVTEGDTGPLVAPRSTRLTRNRSQPSDLSMSAALYHNLILERCDISQRSLSESDSGDTVNLLLGPAAWVNVSHRYPLSDIPDHASVWLRHLLYSRIPRRGENAAADHYS